MFFQRESFWSTAGGGGGGGSGTVTSVSVTTANGVSGSVANATTTPAISLTLGAITPTSVNGNTITTGSGTLTLDAGKTLRVSNTLRLIGTDSTEMTFPGTNASIARIDAAQTFSGVQTFGDRIINTVNGALSAPAVSIIGTPITGGSSTTTHGLVKFGSGAAGNLSVNGTMLEINAPTGFTGNLISAQVNGAVPVLSITAGGALSIPNGDITTGGQLQLGATKQILWTGRSIITAPSAANIQFGAIDSASPVAQTLTVQSVVAGTTDTAGVDWTLNGSRGTGTAKSGNLVRKTGNTTTTGNSQHTLSTREMVAAKFVDLTSATATTLFTVTVATGSYFGCIIDATVWATDAGGDQQVLQSVVMINTANKAGAIGTTGISQTDCANPYNTAGTLTPVTYTLVDNGSGVLAVKCTATSSLTETFLRCKWQARINSNDAATVTAS